MKTNYLKLKKFLYSLFYKLRSRFFPNDKNTLDKKLEHSKKELATLASLEKENLELLRKRQQELQERRLILLNKIQEYEKAKEKETELTNTAGEKEKTIYTTSIDLKNKVRSFSFPKLNFNFKNSIRSIFKKIIEFVRNIKSVDFSSLKENLYTTIQDLKNRKSDPHVEANLQPINKNELYKNILFSLTAAFGLILLILLIFILARTEKEHYGLNSSQSQELTTTTVTSVSVSE